MTSLLLVLAIGRATADDYTLPTNLNETVLTPLGEVRGFTIRGICRADRVYIGDITDVESYQVTFHGRETIRSDVEITVSHPLKGSSPTRVYVEQVSGGTVGDRVVRSTHAALNPTIGKRYLLAQMKAHDPRTGEEPWVVGASLELDANVEIPQDSPKQFMEYVDQYCPAVLAP
jgi:hypothetical protein